MMIHLKQEQKGVENERERETDRETVYTPTLTLTPFLDVIHTYTYACIRIHFIRAFDIILSPFSLPQQFPIFVLSLSLLETHAFHIDGLIRGGCRLWSHCEVVNKV